jgi:hypothetical protein
MSAPGSSSLDPDSVEALLLRASTELQSAWSSERFVPLLREAAAKAGGEQSGWGDAGALLELAATHYTLLDARAQARLLLAAGCLRPAEQRQLEAPLRRLVEVALAEGQEEWAGVIARLIGRSLGVEAALEAQVRARPSASLSPPLSPSWARR